LIIDLNNFNSYVLSICKYSTSSTKSSAGECFCSLQTLCVKHDDKHYEHSSPSAGLPDSVWCIMSVLAGRACTVNLAATDQWSYILQTTLTGCRHVLWDHLGWQGMLFWICLLFLFIYFYGCKKKTACFV